MCERTEIAEWEKLTWTDSNGGEVSVKVGRTGLTAHEFVEELVQSLLLGISYHPHSVDEALGNDNFTEPSDRGTMGI